MSDSCQVRPKGFKEFLRSWSFWKALLGLVIGGVAGFLYYHFVGCQSGTCAITSNAYSSIVFGSLMGFFLVVKPCRSC